ncbi:MAG TPA: hypothetical protein VME46_10720 [Acidimicrobiales bacterium]|nr:hypothetical protein [Acidimicrobiales bacterium]
MSGDTGRRNPGGGGMGLPVMGDNAPVPERAVTGPVVALPRACGLGPAWAAGLGPA